MVAQRIRWDKKSTSTMSKFNAFLAAIGLILSLSTLRAQSVPPALAAQFEITLKAQRNVLGVKSLSAAVQLSNDSVWAGAFGISSTFPLDSVTPNHAYAIGSITKTITALFEEQVAKKGDTKILTFDDDLR